MGEWRASWDGGFAAQYGDSVLEQARIAFGEVATVQDLNELIDAGDLSPNAVELAVRWLDREHPEDPATRAVSAAYAGWLRETGPRR